MEKNTKEEQIERMKKTNLFLRIVSALLISLIIILIVLGLTDKKIGFNNVKKDKKENVIKVISNVKEYEEAAKLNKVAFFFTLSECTPCNKQKDVYRQITEKDKSKKIFVIDLNNKNLKEIINKNEVKLAPTTLFLKDGKLIQKTQGVISEKTFNIIYNN